MKGAEASLLFGAGGLHGNRETLLQIRSWEAMRLRKVWRLRRRAQETARQHMRRTDKRHGEGLLEDALKPSAWKRAEDEFVTKASGALGLGPALGIQRRPAPVQTSEPAPDVGPPSERASLEEAVRQVVARALGFQWWWHPLRGRLCHTG